MPHTVRLRIDLFTKAARLAGFRSDYALAKSMDVNRSTVARVLSGELQPGPAFIGGALVALFPLQFHDLFEVVPASTSAEDSQAERQGSADQHAEHRTIHDLAGRSDLRRTGLARDTGSHLA
ncbi:transcriptional regulator [Actinosynnema sp. NPDC091369]